MKKYWHLTKVESIYLPFLFLFLVLMYYFFPTGGSLAMDITEMFLVVVSYNYVEGYPKKGRKFFHSSKQLLSIFMGAGIFFSCKYLFGGQFARIDISYAALNGMLLVVWQEFHFQFRSRSVPYVYVANNSEGVWNVTVFPRSLKLSKLNAQGFTDFNKVQKEIIEAFESKGIKNIYLVTVEDKRHGKA